MPSSGQTLTCFVKTVFGITSLRFICMSDILLKFEATKSCSEKIVINQKKISNISGWVVKEI